MPDDKDEHSVSMVPFGLTVLSIATFLLGFAAIFQSRTAWAPYFTMALLFGGVGELLAGMWAFAYREPIVATVFSFLGLFYAWFGLTNLIFLGGTAEKVAEIGAIISSVIAAIASFTDLHRRAGLGEVLMVDELARKAREKLAEKIRPSEA